jgi:ectoine hydroxylase-related dioxygenase (phytanoyl-CoA dioxygenase family)
VTALLGRLHFGGSPVRSFVVGKPDFLGFTRKPPPSTFNYAWDIAHPKAVPIIGRPGTVVFFDANIVHSSGHNLSGDDRWQAYVVYNQVKNKPEEVEQPRPDYVRSTNFAPLEIGSDEILDGAQIG